MRIGKKLNTIKEFFKGLPKKMAEHNFLAFLGLLFISLIIGGIILYKYDITARRKEIKVGAKPLRFQKKKFENVLKIIKEREENFKEADFKKWENPFQKPFIPPVTLPQATSTQATSTEKK